MCSNLPPPAFMNNQTASPSTTSLSPSPPSLIALPSMSHSLSALPAMTNLPDMLHYGTFGGGPTRDISEAKARTIALHIHPSSLIDDRSRRSSSTLLCRNKEKMILKTEYIHTYLTGMSVVLLSAHCHILNVRLIGSKQPHLLAGILRKMNVRMGIRLCFIPNEKR